MLRTYRNVTYLDIRIDVRLRGLNQVNIMADKHIRSVTSSYKIQALTVRSTLRSHILNLSNNYILVFESIANDETVYFLSGTENYHKCVALGTMPENI